MPFWRTLEGLLTAVLLQQGSGQLPSRFTLLENVCLETAHVSLQEAQHYPESYDGCAIALLATEGIHSTRTKKYNNDFDAYDVRYFVHHGISPKKAMEYFIHHEKLSITVPFAYASELAQLTDAERLPLYTGVNIISFFTRGIPSEEIIELSALRDGTGKPLLTAKNILAFKTAGGTVGYARDLANLRDEEGTLLLTGFQIFRYAQLGMKMEEIVQFHDTEKPNAIVIFPTEDYNGVFELESVSTLFREIKRSYDVWVRFAITEQDVYDAILSVPDTELLFVAGHGSSKTLRLGGERAEAAWRRRGSGKRVVGTGKHLFGLYERNVREEYFIDTTDHILEVYLRFLHPNATIFLLSCLTGDGGAENTNLATFISTIAGERRVLASKELFTPAQVRINSVYPFDVRIIKDVTYSNK